MKRQNLRTVGLTIGTFTYLVCGAAIFGWLESEHAVELREKLELLELIIRRKYNISDDDFKVLTTTIIKSQPHKAGIQWEFTGAFYFATTVVTTIGYGHSTPATTMGRYFCMGYALVGIPLGLIMFQSIGERLNHFVREALKYAKRRFKAHNQEVTQTPVIAVVSVLSSIIILSMAAVFAQYEHWEYTDALYYCFITLTTIGFGDYVALQKDSALQSKPEYVFMSLVFILFGLSVVSSMVNLLVLRLLALNTEDERRDEEARTKDNQDPFQLEGDVITSARRGGDHVARASLSDSATGDDNKLMILDHQPSKCNSIGHQQGWWRTSGGGGGGGGGGGVGEVGVHRGDDRLALVVPPVACSGNSAVAWSPSASGGARLRHQHRLSCLPAARDHYHRHRYHQHQQGDNGHEDGEEDDDDDEEDGGGEEEEEDDDEELNDEDGDYNQNDDDDDDEDDDDDTNDDLGDSYGDDELASSSVGNCVPVASAEQYSHHHQHVRTHGNQHGNHNHHRCQRNHRQHLHQRHHRRNQRSICYSPPGVQFSYDTSHKHPSTDQHHHHQQTRFQCRRQPPPVSAPSFYPQQSPCSSNNKSSNFLAEASLVDSSEATSVEPTSTSVHRRLRSLAHHAHHHHHHHHHRSRHHRGQYPPVSANGPAPGGGGAPLSVGASPRRLPAGTAVVEHTVVACEEEDPGSSCSSCSWLSVASAGGGAGSQPTFNELLPLRPITIAALSSCQSLGPAASGLHAQDRHLHNNNSSSSSRQQQRQHQTARSRDGLATTTTTHTTGAAAPAGSKGQLVAQLTATPNKQRPMVSGSAAATNRRPVRKLVCKCCCQHSECIEHALQPKPVAPTGEEPANEAPVQRRATSLSSRGDHDNNGDVSAGAASGAGGGGNNGDAGAVVELPQAQAANGRRAESASQPNQSE